MSAPRKYRKRPVVITAMQLTADNVRDVQAWCNAGEAKGARVQWHYPDNAGEPTDREGWLVLTTVHGEEAIARPGDWVIPEPQPGRYYPCAADVFAATYEAVSE